MLPELPQRKIYYGKGAYNLIMREGIKMTARYEVFYMLLVQLMASAISLLFSLVAFWWFLDKAIWKEILSAIFIIVNGGIIYSHAHRFAVQDNKPYTPMKASPVKGIMMGLIITAVNLLLFAALKGAWYMWESETGLTSWIGICTNALFSMWLFPYFGIMGLSHGQVTWYSIAIFTLMPPIASYIGYTAGCKQFYLLEAFTKFSYEKKK